MRRVPHPLKVGRSSLAALATLLLAACRATSSGIAPAVTPTPLGPPPAAAAVLRGHLSPLEARELAVIRWIHEGPGIIQRFRDSGALAYVHKEELAPNVLEDLWSARTTPTFWD